MSDYKLLRFDVADHVATLTFDNPSKRNALDPAMRVEVMDVPDDPSGNETVME